MLCSGYAGVSWSSVQSSVYRKSKRWLQWSSVSQCLWLCSSLIPVFLIKDSQIDTTYHNINSKNWERNLWKSWCEFVCLLGVFQRWKQRNRWLPQSIKAVQAGHMNQRRCSIGLNLKVRMLKVPSESLTAQSAFLSLENIPSLEEIRTFFLWTWNTKWLWELNSYSP